MLRSDQETLVAAVQRVRQLVRRYRRRNMSVEAERLAAEVLAILDGTDVQEARMRIDRRYMFRVLENPAVKQLGTEGVAN